MISPKQGILLVNTGTPDSPSVADVRRYLNQFLMDGRVIDIPFIQRALLVRGIIVPFRAPKSAKLYGEIWDEKTGSPLMYNSLLQQQGLQAALGDDYQVELAMRYQNPSIESALNKLKANRVNNIRIISLFPQYASATTGSIVEEVMRLVGKWAAMPDLSFVNAFYDQALMIDVFAENARKHLATGDYDHVLFSYHGLPIRQLKDVDGTGNHDCDRAGCREHLDESNKFCYTAQCYATTRLIVQRLGLDSQNYGTCFQSRLGKTPWIQPYTSDVLKMVAEGGKKRLLVLCPAFVADCLETIHEIGIEYAHEFSEYGGEKVTLVESLNGHPQWIELLRQMATGELISTPGLQRNDNTQTLA